MKKTLQFLILLLMACLGFSDQLKAQTTTPVALAADLTYVNIAPNIYLMQYRYFRDCSALAPMPDSLDLNYTAVGCHTGGTLKLAKQSAVLGQPYCGQQGCIPGKINYHEITYTSALTLPGMCANWVLSVTSESRRSNNLAASPNNNLYTEISLNNLATQTNTSPVFSNAPLFFALKNLQMVYNHHVTDLEGDSLIYSLVDPLNSHNVPVTFQPGFSATDPVISSGPFTIDRFTGSVSFRPTMAADSIFTFRVLVTEYRTINGVPTVLSTIGRDLAVVVPVPLPPNPFAVAFTVNGQPMKPIMELGILGNECIPITITRTSGNSPIRITTNAYQYIPGSYTTVTGNDSVKTLLFCWKPRYSDIRSTPYLFQITVRNNDCPVPSFTVYNVQIKVVQQKRPDNPGPIDVISPQPPSQRLAAPNVITPNNDGKNDAFVVQGTPGKTEIQIFDRNRRLVYSDQNYKGNWKGEGLRNDTYFYILKDKETGELLKGTIEVIR